MLKISKEHLQLQAGIPWPVMSCLGYQQQQYVDPCYRSHLWEFIDDIGTNMRFEFDPWLQPQRKHDTFIMDLQYFPISLALPRRILPMPNAADFI